MVLALDIRYSQCCFRTELQIILDNLPYNSLHDSKVQSFAQFRMGVLFEVITCCMVPSEIKCWYDNNI